MTKEGNEGNEIDLEITLWLNRWKTGDRMARDRLFENLYPRLRRLASHHMYRGHRDHSVQVNEMVHELYLSLEDQRCPRWQNRAHFFAIAGRLMRRIVVDHERRTLRHKRGGGKIPLSIQDAGDLAWEGSMSNAELLALSQALAQLEAIDEKAAKVISLRYFVGLTHDETAANMGIGRATVTRLWRSARRWLRRRLGDHLAEDLR